MKKIKYFTIIISNLLASLSCTKDIDPPITVSLNVINAAVNSVSVQVNSLGLGVIYSGFPTVNYGSNLVYTMPVGSNTVTIVLTADTLHPIYDNTIMTKANTAIYSLYLVGQSPTYDNILTIDTIPYRTDSSAGIRFINLSPNSNPISIDIQGKPDGSEVGTLAYKSYTSFKTYPASSLNNSYIFEIRDSASGALITTYSLNTPRFHNCTLALIGLIGGTGITMPGIMRVNNY